MSKLRRIAALGLTAVLLGGCVPQKVAAPEKAEETKAEEAKTEESQAKNEAKNEGTNETAAEAETAAAIATEITGPVEITIWHQYSDQYEVWFQKVADEFHAKNPDITVKLQYQPADQYEAKVMAAAKADDLPSMVHSAAANMTSYINEGALVNMDDYIYDSTVGYENFDEDINSGLNQMYVPWGNKRYAMPLFLGGNVFFYNKTMFEELGIEPPKTWSEVEAVATAVSDKIGKPGFGFQIMVDGYMEVLTQAGGEVIDLENKTIGFDSETAREKITWYKDLIDKKVARLVGDDKHFTNPFANGDVGCYVALSGNYGYLATAVGDKFELGGTQEVCQPFRAGICHCEDQSGRGTGQLDVLKILTEPGSQCGVRNGIWRPSGIYCGHERERIPGFLKSKSGGGCGLRAERFLRIYADHSGMV